MWAASRLAVATAAYAAGFLLVSSTVGSRPSWLRGWYHWDVALYIKAARYGYAGYPQHYPDRGIAAFFPGLPLVLRAVHVIVPSWVAAGLVVSLVACGVACLALARLAEPSTAHPAPRPSLLLSCRRTPSSSRCRLF